MSKQPLAHLRVLLADEPRWRWALLVALAIVVAGMEALAAALVYVLVGLVVSPEAQVLLPFVGDLAAWFPGLDGQQLRTGLAVFVAVYFAVKSVVVVGRTYVQERLLSNVGVRISDRLLRGYLDMPYREHTKRNTSELVRNSFDGTQIVVMSTFLPLVLLMAEAVTSTALIVVLVLTSPLATAMAAVVFLPSLWLLQRRVLPRLAAHGRLMQDSRTGVIQAIQQSLGAIRDIKLLDRSSEFLGEHLRHRVRLARSFYVARTLQAIPRALIETTLIVTIVAVFITAILAGMDVPSVLATLGLFAYVGLRLQPSLQIIVGSYNQLRTNSPVVEDLARDLEDVRAWQAAGGDHRSDEATEASVPPRAGESGIVIDDVTFAYEPGAEVLQSVRLEVPPGRFLGICGGSGGGKSTLVDLILGLVQPSSGEVRIDGRPLGKVPRWWWSRLGAVSQQVYLTDDTLRANIVFGDPEPDVVRLERCVRRAQLASLVDELPLGLDTIVGERGVRLSGGQRQRVAIARALYREPDVLILDEGTSALDGATETAVVDALSEMGSDRTLIAVAHRLSTLRGADEIIVLDEGRIADRGTYAELMMRSEKFRALAGTSND